MVRRSRMTRPQCNSRSPDRGCRRWRTSACSPSHHSQPLREDLCYNVTLFIIPHMIYWLYNFLRHQRAIISTVSWQCQSHMCSRPVTLYVHAQVNSIFSSRQNALLPSTKTSFISWNYKLQIRPKQCLHTQKNTKRQDIGYAICS